MRNLKKVLSLVLCLAVMMSVMVVGASAATFSDEDQIANPEATFLLNALGIVEGRENGAFDGTASITRAEASKLIACLNLKGQPVPQANGAPTFADVLTSNTSKWAIDYIEYLVAQGSVNGLGNGNFGPDMKVTGVQFAKMLLGVLGYDPITEKFVGADWEYYTNTQAVKANLYVGLEKIDVTAPLTRDDAAQMMFNALKAKTVIYLTDTTGALKLTNKDLMQTLYPTVDYKFGEMMGIKYNTKTGVYTYDVNGTDVSTKTDYTDMLGENVMYVMDRVEGTLGIYSFKNTVVTGQYADLDDKKIDGNTQKDLFMVSPSGDVNSVTLRGTTIPERFAFHDYYAYKAIDSDADGMYDRVIIYQVKFDAVQHVNSERVKMTNNVAVKNNTLYDGIAKGDFVAITFDTSVKTVKVLSKLTAQAGVVNSINEKLGKITEVVIGGTSYKFCNTANPGDAAGLDQISKPLHNWPGKTVNYYVYNGYVLCMQEDVSLSRDYVLITSINGDYNTDGRSVNATALFGDNTTKEITIASLDGKQGEAMRTEILAYMDQPQGNTNAYGQIGYLARYEVKADGSYALTSTYKLDQMVAAGAADLGFTKTAAVYSAPATKPVFKPALNNTESAYIQVGNDVVRIAGDAQVFLVDKSGVTYAAVAGSDIANLTDHFKQGLAQVNYVGYEKGADGFLYATLIYIQTNVQKMTPSITAVVVSQPQFKAVEGDEYIYFDVYDGDAVYSVQAKTHGTPGLYNLKPGHVVEFVMNDGKIQAVKFVDGQIGAITAWNDKLPYANLKIATGNPTIAAAEANAKAYTLADDAQVIIMDTKNLVPAAGEIAISDDNGTRYYKNVWFVADGSEIVLMIVDTATEHDITILNEN